jgi:hypothetical protein
MLVCQFVLLLKIQPMIDISLQLKSMGMQCVNFAFWWSFYALIFDIKHLQMGSKRDGCLSVMVP